MSIFHRYNINCHANYCDITLSYSHNYFFDGILGPGSVTSVRFPTDKDSTMSKGYAFVDMPNVLNARRVRSHTYFSFKLIKKKFKLFILCATHDGFILPRVTNSHLQLNSCYFH